MNAKDIKAGTKVTIAIGRHSGRNGVVTGTKPWRWAGHSYWNVRLNVSGERWSLRFAPYELKRRS